MRCGDAIDDILEGVAATVSRVRCRTLINRAQNQILGVDNSITEIQPAPYFKTVAGQYSYQANGSFFDARNIDAGDALTVDIRNVRTLYQNDREGCNWPLWYKWPAYTDGRHRGLDFDCTESAVIGSNDCRIDLRKTFDLGDTTNLWVGRAYRWPRQVISEDTILEVPDDFCETLLYLQVTEYIEARQYGRADATGAPLALAHAAFLEKYGNPVRQNTPRFTTPFSGRR